VMRTNKSFFDQCKGKSMRTRCDGSTSATSWQSRLRKTRSMCRRPMAPAPRNCYAQLSHRGQMRDSATPRASRDWALRRIEALTAPKPL
jgi:hypothetical protein